MIIEEINIKINLTFEVFSLTARKVKIKHIITAEKSKISGSFFPG